MLSTRLCVEERGLFQRSFIVRSRGEIIRRLSTGGKNKGRRFNTVCDPKVSNIGVGRKAQLNYKPRFY